MLRRPVGTGRRASPGGALRTNLKGVREDWRNGRSYGYPRCCIAMYCWDRLWDLPPSLTRGAGQRLEPPESSLPYVPCGIIHDGGLGLPLRARLSRLWTFWFRTLQLEQSGAAGRESRVRAPWRSRPPQNGAWNSSAPSRPRVPWVGNGAWDSFELAKRPLESAWAELDGLDHDPGLEWA